MHLHQVGDSWHADDKCLPNSLAYVLPPHTNTNDVFYFCFCFCAYRLPADGPIRHHFDAALA